MRSLLQRGTLQVPAESATYSVNTPSLAPPANPKNGQVWLSSRWQDGYIPAGKETHQHVMGPGGGLEGAWVQEPQVWFNTATNQFCMLYTGGVACAYLFLATCPATADPLVSTNWTKNATPVIGNGNGGWAGTAAHPGVFIEGSTIYAYFNDPAAGNLRVCTASTSALSTFTSIGVVLRPPSGTIVSMANPHILNVAGTYTMFYEVRDSTGNRWQQGRATCATPTGKFTSVAFPLPGLEINAGKSTASNMFIVKEGSLYVAWLHGSWGAYQTSPYLPTAAYRATFHRPEHLDDHGRRYAPDPARSPVRSGPGSGCVPRDRANWYQLRLLVRQRQRIQQRPPHGRCCHTPTDAVGRGAVEAACVSGAGRP